jgi:hypothetical protein
MLHLAISPLIKELVDRLTNEEVDYPAESHVGRLIRVTLDELAAMPQQKLSLPVSAHLRSAPWRMRWSATRRIAAPLKFGQNGWRSASAH